MTSIRLAPMAGITDWPFRLLCYEQGCDMATTEMVSAMGYVYAPRNHPATVSLIERHPDEPRLFVQIFGKEADLMARAADELTAMGRFEGLGVNMGCPAHKVASSGEGSGLMRNPENAEKILRAVVNKHKLNMWVVLHKERTRKLRDILLDTIYWCYNRYTYRSIVHRTTFLLCHYSSYTRRSVCPRL